MSPLMRTMLIWGVWLLIPLLMDGVGSVLRVLSVFFQRDKVDPDKYKDKDLPKVSLIIPAYNEEKIIGRTLSSLQMQDYPQDKMEILVVDDGSLDATSDVVLRYINNQETKRMKINGTFYSVGEYGGTINLFTSGVNKGKANALNLGIKNSHGDIIFTIDSDTVLDLSAIRNMVTYLMDNKEVGAACGVIEINWHMLEERDKEGELVLDEEGEIKEKKLYFSESFIAKSQFLEYVNAFRLGRHYQKVINSEYMLSGAFSAFKREAIEKIALYSDLTVAEDFDISLDLHQHGVKVGFCDTAKVWVEPVIDMGALYAQRVRWRRGQIEVMGVHKNMIASNKFGWLGRLGLPSMMLYDHTFAFPRLIWIFLLLLFPFFGYSQAVIALFFVFLYVFYVVFDVLQTFAAYSISDENTKDAIGDSFQYVLLLPFYRFIVFYFRVSGYLSVFKEPQSWKVSWPLDDVKSQAEGVQHRMNGGTRGIVSFLYSILDIFRYV